MPDIHQLNPYKLKFINEKIEFFANENNFKYLDLLSIFDPKTEREIDLAGFGDANIQIFFNLLE